MGNTGSRRIEELVEQAVNVVGLAQPPEPGSRRQSSDDTFYGFGTDIEPCARAIAPQGFPIRIS